MSLVRWSLLAGMFLGLPYKVSRKQIETPIIFSAIATLCDAKSVLVRNEHAEHKQYSV